MLTLQDFDFELPKELIAFYPTPKRGDAKLLVLNRATRQTEHRIFNELPDFLKKGDLLVLNDTKVFPARLFGVRPTGGKVEALLLKQMEEGVWEFLVKPSGRIKKGTCLTFGENGLRLEGEILDEPRGENGIRKIRFSSEGLREKLAYIGKIPLPPYIERPSEEIDRELYQTVFADKEGAVASPTAGLHFDEELLEKLRNQGIEICFVTLHVSYGTFQPVQTEDLSKHEIYEEEFEIGKKAAEQINRALIKKRRVIACGTTVVRTLESIGKNFVPQKGKTRLFIRPPYPFQVVDAMITNFHIPKTTLLMLVSAFAGHDLVFRAYQEAIRKRCRFYSYGDAMIIL